jgi:hypothetical protein
MEMERGTRLQLGACLDPSIPFASSPREKREEQSAASHEVGLGREGKREWRLGRPYSGTAMETMGSDGCPQDRCCSGPAMATTGGGARALLLASHGDDGDWPEEGEAAAERGDGGRGGERRMGRRRGAVDGEAAVENEEIGGGARLVRFWTTDCSFA